MPELFQRVSAGDFERTYAAIGRLILEHQKAEDALLTMFEISLGGSPERAAGIFNQVSGLNHRLALVSAAMLDQGADLQEAWRNCGAQIQQVAELRNHVAHGELVHFGGGMTFDLRADPPTATRTGPPRLEIHKPTRRGDLARKALEEVEHSIGLAQDNMRAIRDISAALRAPAV